MKQIKGTHTTANVMIDEVDEKTVEQIQTICSQEIFSNAKIRIMADCHAGKGSCIGFTAICNANKVIPNLVGVDISCTVSRWKLNVYPDFAKLDDFIRKNIPHGSSIRNEIAITDEDLIYGITNTAKEIDKEDRIDYFIKSIGTLGDGNHFISVETDKDNIPWLLIHTGSRNFGKCICEYHQNIAYQKLSEKQTNSYREILKNIEPQKRQQFLEDKKHKIIDPVYAYLEDEDAVNYIKHVKIAEKFAYANHKVIASKILEFLGLDISNCEYTITNHNYIEQIDNEHICIRKGAVSTKKDEILLIPLNMADGTLVCKGKGNPNWNYSAPHGAGRILSRNSAKKCLSLDEYRNKMNGIYSTCIKTSTLDEAPMAYKNADFITSNVGDVVDIIDHLKPVYNFKAS